MSFKASYVSVILPAYNEAGNIIPLIEAIHEELVLYRHQIIVVDDNSPDGTYKLVSEKSYPYVKTLLRIKDPSLALSIRAGLELSDGDVLVVMDSDFNHQPKYVRQMVHNLEFYDAVVASRFVYGGKMDSRARHLLSWVFNIFVRMMTGKYITDSLYGFWAIRRSALERVDFNKIFWGYGDYCIRLLYYLQKPGVEILQIPAVNGQRLKGQSNSRFFQVFIQYAKESFLLVLRERLKLISARESARKS